MTGVVLNKKTVHLGGTKEENVCDEGSETQEEVGQGSCTSPTTGSVQGQAECFFEQPDLVKDANAHDRGLY